MEELEAQQELRDQVGNLTFSPPPMKKSDTRDSISSVDSDVSLSFDRRGSKGEEADLSESGSNSDAEIKLSKNSSSDRDSGADCVDELVPRESDISTVLSDKSTTPSSAIETDFVAPNDELADRICAQVEFYFSDENIVKDAFLLKHVKRNKEGYVSLKLISSFKRVKHLSRDWRVVGAALARSKKLEVNELGTKLRRLEPLPPYDQTAPSRTVLAARLPLERLTVESVAEIFASCGEIALIRVLRPGHPAPAEVRQAIAKRAELGSSEECALIEFTDSASARIALKMSLGGEARIYELQQQPDKRRKQQPSKKSAMTRIAREESYNSSSCASGSEAEDGRGRHRRPMMHGYPAYTVYPAQQPFQGPPAGSEAWLSRRLSSCSMSGSDNGFVLRRLSSCSGSGSGSGSSSDAGNGIGRRFSTCSSGSDAAYYHPTMYNNHVGCYAHQNRRFSCCSGSGSDCGSGTGFHPGRRGSADCGSFLRRLSACSRDSGFDVGARRQSSCSSASESGYFRPRSNSGVVVMPHLPENIKRMPSGPDGTRGFGRPPRIWQNSMEPACS